MANTIKKVLIGEDEKPLAKALQLKLKKFGIEATVAFNGKDVLSVVEKDKFDLILLDLVMPEKDGFTVLSELKEKGNQIPIIVSSNLGQEMDIKRTKELGAKDYIIKSDTPIIKIVERIKKELGVK